MASSFIIYTLALLGPISGLPRLGKVYSQASVYKQSPTELAPFSKEYRTPKSQSAFHESDGLRLSQIRTQTKEVELFISEGHEDIVHKTS